MDLIYFEEIVVILKDGDVKFCRLGDWRFRRDKGLSFEINMLKLYEIMRSFCVCSCILCFKLYDLDECFEFLKKLLMEWRNCVKEKGFCFGCYSFEYIVKLCKGRKFCLICCKKFLMFFYDYSWK